VGDTESLLGSAGPKFGHDVTQNVPDPHIRYGIIDGFNGLWRIQLETLVKGDYTIPGDQIIHYPPVVGRQQVYVQPVCVSAGAVWSDAEGVLRVCAGLLQEDGGGTGRTCCMWGYWILQDQQALLSYSYNGEVMTIDPVSTANDGWETFLGVYNQWCSDRNGVPLLNQTWGADPGDCAEGVW